MLSVGVDIIELERVQHALDRFGERFAHKVYTAREIAYCRGRVPELAVRFAAKEAVSKALGTGINGLLWTEMEILADERGKPLVVLHGRALARAQLLGLSEWAVSMSHSDHDAVAFVAAQ